METIYVMYEWVEMLGLTVLYYHPNTGMVRGPYLPQHITVTNILSVAPERQPTLYQAHGLLAIYVMKTCTCHMLSTFFQFWY